MLTPDELARYQRQLVLPELGVAGQERLCSARVLVIGAGGLGSPASLYLAAAGVGTLGIADDDEVALSNLHRQVLHRTSDVGRPKTASAEAALRALNPHVEIRLHAARLDTQRAREIAAEYDLVVDGSDNYPTRYAINDACAELGKVWVYGSVERFSGQLSTFGAPDGPCYRCLFPEPPAPGTSPSCEEIGVLGAVPGVIGSLQALEALKWIAGIGEPLVGRLLQVDLLRVQTSVVHVERREGCPTCARRDRRAGDGRRTAAESPAAVDMEPAELASRMRAGAAPMVLDVREPWEWRVARIEGATLLPMGELPVRLAELDRERDLVVYCHTGVRSSMATNWLRSQGFRARNLAGGIDRWSRDVDGAVPRY